MYNEVVKNFILPLNACNDGVKNKRRGLIPVETIQLVEKYRSRVHIEDLNQSELICFFHTLDGNFTCSKTNKNNNITIIF